MDPFPSLPFPQRLAPHVGRSVAALVERWRAMASAAPGGEVELDVAEWYQAVAEEAIARATFGRSYDSGRVVFRMQARLMAFASEAFRKVFVPGYRFVRQARTPEVCLCSCNQIEDLI